MCRWSTSVQHLDSSADSSWHYCLTFSSVASLTGKPLGAVPDSLSPPPAAEAELWREQWEGGGGVNYVHHTDCTSPFENSHQDSCDTFQSLKVSIAYITTCLSRQLETITLWGTFSVTPLEALLPHRTDPTRRGWAQSVGLWHSLSFLQCIACRTFKGWTTNSNNGVNVL